MPIVLPKDYHSQLAEFVKLVTTHQGTKDNAAQAFSESGRKYDKILIKSSIGEFVRYFIERKTGNIYGAKSKFAPNPKWYFGNISKANLWDWSGFHGVPVNDESVRVVKSYAGYQHIIQV